MQKDQILRRPSGIDALDANHCRVSVHKYGFFLCLRGTARVLLGDKIYLITAYHLCIYTPNTFFRILEKSEDLDGILHEGPVDEYYPAVSSINIRKRLMMREKPVVRISREEATDLADLCDSLDRGMMAQEGKMSNETLAGIRENYLIYLRYAVCLNVCGAYFSNSPVEAVPQDRDDIVFNKFLVSLYEHCHTERTVSFYAALQHLSPYYFSTIIRSRSGKSALQWIESVTMTYARKYLADSSESIKEIAELLSFPDQSAFGRYFRCRQGCSPSEYRRNINKGAVKG